MKIKIVGIFVTTLLIATVIPINATDITDLVSEDTEPDLNCFGELIWDDVTPGTIAKNIFYVENIGGAISMLDWEITEWPEWGVWYFLPPEGEDLLPNNGAVHVHVFVEVDDLPYRDFTGNITIVNKENTSDFEILPVTLSTPNSYENGDILLIRFLQRIIKNHPNAFPIIRKYFGLS